MSTNLNEIYNVEKFENVFKMFMEETEFGTSVYSVCYDLKKTIGLKDYILKLKYSDEGFKYVVMNYIPPSKMIDLRKLVEESTDKLYSEIHIDE